MKLKEHIYIGRRLVKLLYSLGHRYFYALVLSSLVTALTPYVPIWFSARLIDGLASGAPLQTLALYAALTVGITALLGLINAWLKAQKQIGENEDYKSINWMYAQKAMELAYASIEDREVARLRERVQNETDTGYNLFYLVNSLDRSIGSVIQILASISLTASFFAAKAVPLWTKLVFAGGVILTMVLRILTNGRSAKLQMEYFSGCTDFNMVLNKYWQYLNHYTSGMDIRLYGMEKLLADYAEQVYDELCDGEQTMRFRCAWLDMISTVTNYGLRFGVYLILIGGALSGGLSVGSIAQYVSCIMLLLNAISSIVSAVQLSLVNHGYAKRFFSYFDIPNPMYKGSLSVEKREDNEYCIEFKNVSFRYPNTEAYALRHVNLKFKVGQKLAVVGMNGSGKTTFIKLLCRLYDPTEGEILLNEVDIRTFIAGGTGDGKIRISLFCGPAVSGLLKQPGGALTAECGFDVKILHHTHVPAGKCGVQRRHAAHANGAIAPLGHEKGDPVFLHRLLQPGLLRFRQAGFPHFLTKPVFQLQQLPVLRIRKPFHGEGNSFLWG